MTVGDVANGLTVEILGTGRIYKLLKDSKVVGSVSLARENHAVTHPIMGRWAESSKGKCYIDPRLPCRIVD